jgi:hypothetical protein
MSNELMRPIDPETARAIEETAKLGSKLVEAGTKAGGYLDRVFGRLPDNFLGLVVGDWVLHTRIRRWAELQAETERILRKRGVTEPLADVSPSVAVPLIEAAVDETREGLKELWARLLAAAMDPARSQLVRQTFITALKAMDPLDPRILQQIWQKMPAGAMNENDLSNALSVARDEVDVSIYNLRRLGCILDPALSHAPALSAFGRELMRACEG